MAQILVRNLDESIKRDLKVAAQKRGRSVEELVRQILRNAAKTLMAPVGPLGSKLAWRFSSCGLSEPIRELRGSKVSAAGFDK